MAASPIEPVRGVTGRGLGEQAGDEEARRVYAGFAELSQPSPAEQEFARLWRRDVQGEMLGWCSLLTIWLRGWLRWLRIRAADG